MSGVSKFVVSKPVLGALLVVIYTGLISCADGITKFLASDYAAAQLYVLSGGVVAALCLAASFFQLGGHEENKIGRRRPRGGRLFGGAIAAQAQGSSLEPSEPSENFVGLPLRTLCPGTMALRCVATVLAALGFFYAFRLLPFAQVFLFVGLMPLMAGVMSGVILSEQIKPRFWAALFAGFVGVLFLFPGGISSITSGHFFAVIGAGSGTFSMVLARYISRYDSNLLPQVFYPNLALCIAMLPVLPFVWRTMPVSDLLWALSYAVLLFGARWLAVAALRLLPAYVVTPLMNLQFVWMLVIGGVAFDEVPHPGTWVGGLVVIASGLYLLRGQSRLAVGGRLQTDPST